MAGIARVQKGTPAPGWTKRGAVRMLQTQRLARASEVSSSGVQAEVVSKVHCRRLYLLLSQKVVGCVQLVKLLV